MKNVAGGLRLDLAAFRALEAFAQLGTELDPATQSQLDRGYRMVELLKQPQYQPLNVVDEILVIYAGTMGYLDKVPIPEVQRWERDFLNYVHTNRQDVWDLLDAKKDEGDTLKAGKDKEVLPKVKELLDDYARQYSPKKAGQPVAVS